MNKIKNKTVITFMVAMLAMNFYAWTAVTVKNDKTVENIYKVLESCKVKNG